MGNRLSKDDKIRMYRLYDEHGLSQGELSDIFNVSQPTVSLTLKAIGDEAEILNMRNKVAQLEEENKKLASR